MKKIVMLGCENSHVKTFLKIMNENPEKYRGIEVIGVATLEEAVKGLLQEAEQTAPEGRAGQCMTDLLPAAAQGEALVPVATAAGKKRSGYT